MDLSYREYGNKDSSLIVFIHGGGVSSWMWNEQINYFHKYHCMTVDLPEQGASKDTDKFTILSSAEKINQLIKKVADNKRVIIIGFSLGAQVAIQMLSLDPDLADYAMINSALVRPNALLKKMIRPSVKLSFPLIKNKSFSKLQSKTLYIGEDYFDTYYKESSQMKSDTLVRILEENMSFKIPENFDKAKANILVTVGEKEKSVMKKSATELVSANLNCTGIILPKVGHGVSLSNPDFFNHLIENWLEEGRLPESTVAR